MGKGKGRGSKTAKTSRWAIDGLRESRGEMPSASTRHSSTTFKPAPKISKRKEVIRVKRKQGPDANAHEDREEDSSN